MKRRHPGSSSSEQPWSSFALVRGRLIRHCRVSSLASALLGSSIVKFSFLGLVELYAHLRRKGHGLMVSQLLGPQVPWPGSYEFAPELAMAFV